MIECIQNQPMSCPPPCPLGVPPWPLEAVVISCKFPATNVPDRVLRAIDYPTMDHRGPKFGHLGWRSSKLKYVFQTQQPVVIYPASGTGAWEAALVNCFSPGQGADGGNGHFASLAENGRQAWSAGELIATDWRRGADPAAWKRN